MTGTTGARCANCTYFRFSGDAPTADTGTCKRYPQPQFKQHDDWCGEHLPVLEIRKHQQGRDQV